MIYGNNIDIQDFKGINKIYANGKVVWERLKDARKTYVYIDTPSDIIALDVQGEFKKEYLDKITQVYEEGVLVVKMINRLEIGTDVTSLPDESVYVVSDKYPNDERLYIPYSVNSIGTWFLAGGNNLTIYYDGTSDEWNNLYKPLIPCIHFGMETINVKSVVCSDKTIHYECFNTKYTKIENGKYNEGLKLESGGESYTHNSPEFQTCVPYGTEYTITPYVNGKAQTPITRIASEESYTLDFTIYE